MTFSSDYFMLYGVVVIFKLFKSAVKFIVLILEVMSDSIENRFKRDFNAVAFSIPQVDRGRGDPRNILGLAI